MTEEPREDAGSEQFIEDQADDQADGVLDAAEDVARDDLDTDVAAHVDDTDHVDDAVDVPGEPSPDGPGTTGHPAVDEVLRSLEQLEGRPVEEHVAVFEQAHERLRRALASASDDD